MLLDLLSLEFNGMVVQVDNHDGFTYKDYQKHLERLRKLEKSLEMARAEKVAQSYALRDQIRGIEKQKHKENQIDAIQVPIAQENKYQIELIDISLVDIQQQLDSLYRDIFLYNIQANKYRQNKEIEALLLLM